MQPQQCNHSTLRPLQPCHCKFVLSHHCFFCACSSCSPACAGLCGRPAKLCMRRSVWETCETVCHTNVLVTIMDKILMPRLTSICSWLHSMWNVQFLSNHDAPHRLNLYPGGKIWSGAGLQLGSWPGICMQFTVVFSILPPTCVPAQLHRGSNTSSEFLVHVLGHVLKDV